MPNDRAISRPKALSAVLSFPTRWLGIVLLATVGTAHGAPESAPLSEQARQADIYYQQRHDAENVRKALTLVRAAAATNPQDYEDWWRVAMFTNFLARRATKTEESRLLDEGIEAGKKAVALSPNRVEGHFWLGANYGLAADSGSFLKGLRLVDDIRSEMQTVIKLNPEYQQAGALRILARVYLCAPFFLGGNKHHSIELLEECQKRYPQNSQTMLFLADSYLAVGRKEDARRQLESILNHGPDAEFGPELTENQAEAQARLAKYFGIGK